MKEFYNFQNAAGARNAFLADQTERAYMGMSDGKWGLSLGDRVKEMMIDHVGWSFIPLYRIFGPLSMLFIMLIFVVGLLRFVITLLARISLSSHPSGGPTTQREEWPKMWNGGWSRKPRPHPCARFP